MDRERGREALGDTDIFRGRSWRGLDTAAPRHRQPKIQPSAGALAPLWLGARGLRGTDHARPILGPNVSLV